VLALTLSSIHNKSNRLPESSIDDIVNILAEDDIHIDREIISTKIESGRVYVCDPGEYNNKAAEALGGEKVFASYTVPGGEIVVLMSGARFEFYENFEFRYSLDEEKKNLLDEFNLSDANQILNSGAVTHIGKIVCDFLERGNREKDSTNDAGIVTKVNGIWELEGKHYALCSRTVGDVPMAGNTMLCLVEGGVVTQASGTWCFLTVGESYSAQLTDHLNILFNVKKEIARLEHDGRVDIRSIEPCYTVYQIDDYFCLIPCWQVETDLYAKFIFNAINGALVTKN
jgi:hypothetical protein